MSAAPPVDVPARLRERAKGWTHYATIERGRQNAVELANEHADALDLLAAAYESLATQRDLDVKYGRPMSAQALDALLSRIEEAAK